MYSAMKQYEELLDKLAEEKQDPPYFDFTPTVEEEIDEEEIC